MFRIVSGGKWTLDGRWVVIEDGRIIFDYCEPLVERREHELEPVPAEERGTGVFDAFMAFVGIIDCIDFVKEEVGKQGNEAST